MRDELRKRWLNATIKEKPEVFTEINETLQLGFVTKNAGIHWVRKVGGKQLNVWPTTAKMHIEDCRTAKPRHLLEVIVGEEELFDKLLELSQEKKDA